MGVIWANLLQYRHRHRLEESRDFQPQNLRPGLNACSNSSNTRTGRDHQRNKAECRAKGMDQGIQHVASLPPLAAAAWMPHQESPAIVLTSAACPGVRTAPRKQGSFATSPAGFERVAGEPPIMSTAMLMMSKERRCLARWATQLGIYGNPQLTNEN